MAEERLNLKLQTVVATAISFIVTAAFYFALLPLTVDSCTVDGHYMVWRSCVPFQPVTFAIILAAIAASTSWLVLELFKAHVKARVLVSGALFGATLITVLII